MNGSTKILTVSYGTFSCTLEGFDDPLGSMREIAEYFRDLASDDRYFGAEPPTPDAEMLQKIAEKEVRRRVEARVSDSGSVALVAGDSAPETKPEPKREPVEARETPKPEPRRVEAEEDHGPLTYDDDYLMSDEPEDVLTPEPGAQSTESGPAETVAEKLRRIRAVVSRSIELEDKSAIRREQTPNADDPEKRDRALSETIRQIQEDILEDDDDEAEPVAERVERAPEPRRAEPEAREEALDPQPEPEPEPQDEPETPRAHAEEDHWDDDTDEEPSPDPRHSERPVSSRRLRDAAASLAPEPEEDVGRLLDETDSKLNEDDTVRRRRVISQMRAAVAATKADRLVSRQVSRDPEEVEQEPYREDLSEAVEDSEPAQRPSGPTPLVLVSSQRIDTAPMPETASPGDFASFIANVGAREIPELIEAAAAFTVFAEGQSSFTRPEIMKRVARVDPTLRLSREDSLRSFGQLLREGTFRKLERGQFTIDKGTRYNPDQRVANE